jgi:hypothetical protein
MSFARQPAFTRKMVYIRASLANRDTPACFALDCRSLPVVIRFLPFGYRRIARKRTFGHPVQVVRDVTPRRVLIRGGYGACRVGDPAGPGADVERGWDAGQFEGEHAARRGNAGAAVRANLDVAVLGADLDVAVRRF